MRWHSDLLRGPAGLQLSSLPAQPSRADGLWCQCHALGAVTARRTCPGQRSGPSAEGSPTAATEEGLRSGHQRGEERAPGKEPRAGAHRGGACDGGVSDGEARRVADVARRHSCRSARVRVRLGPSPIRERGRRECGGGSHLGEGTVSVAWPNSW
jgi:hypothetical protein